MWMGLFALVLFIVVAIAGLTGFGVSDSRDASYSLHRPFGARRTYEDLLSPQRRRRSLGLRLKLHRG